MACALCGRNCSHPKTEEFLRRETLRIVELINNMIPYGGDIARMRAEIQRADITALRQLYVMFQRLEQMIDATSFSSPFASPFNRGDFPFGMPIIVDVPFGLPSLSDWFDEMDGSQKGYQIYRKTDKESSVVVVDENGDGELRRRGNNVVLTPIASLHEAVQSVFARRDENAADRERTQSQLADAKTALNELQTKLAQAKRELHIALMRHCGDLVTEYGAENIRLGNDNGIAYMYNGTKRVGKPIADDIATIVSANQNEVDSTTAEIDKRRKERSQYDRIITALQNREGSLQQLLFRLMSVHHPELHRALVAGDAEIIKQADGSGVIRSDSRFDTTENVVGFDEHHKAIAFVKSAFDLAESTKVKSVQFRLLLKAGVVALHVDARTIMEITSELLEPAARLAYDKLAALARDLFADRTKAQQLAAEVGVLSAELGVQKTELALSKALNDEPSVTARLEAEIAEKAQRIERLTQEQFQLQALLDAQKQNENGLFSQLLAALKDQPELMKNASSLKLLFNNNDDGITVILEAHIDDILDYEGKPDVETVMRDLMRDLSDEEMMRIGFTPTAQIEGPTTSEQPETAASA